MLNLILTGEDAKDLRDNNRLNAMTEEGVEVLAHPGDFSPLVWAALDSGNPVSIDMLIMGQHTTTEVKVTL